MSKILFYIFLKSISQWVFKYMILKLPASVLPVESINTAPGFNHRTGT